MIDFDTQRELEHLQSKFSHAADRRDYEMMRSLYHSDGYDDHGIFKGDVREFIEWLTEIQEQFENSAHVLTNMLCTVDGDRAESETRGTSFLRMKGPEPYNVIVISRHFDTYERRDGVWRFTHRALCVDWQQSFPPVVGGLDVTSASQGGAMGPADPVYSRLPGLVAELRRA